MRADTSIEKFKDLPDEARLWIYGFESPLAERDRQLVGGRVASFLAEWHSHSEPISGNFAILYDRFVLIAGYNPSGISGCSIDTSVQTFKFLRETCGLNGLNRNLVFFRDRAGEVRALERLAFQEELDTGRVGVETVVFDTTLTSLRELRAGRFETPFARCWHARAFKPRPVADGAPAD